MFAEVLLAVAFQIGPFYQQKENGAALRPLWSREGPTTDVVWPVFTAHDDWWRFCFFTHYQSTDGDGYQFEIMPLWFNGRTRDDESYWGLFPLYGHHPHLLLLYDVDFALWPVWMRYRMPRPSEKRMLRTNAVLFPFIHWREDGSWGFWPLYVCNRQRESYHQTALWPIVTWARYEADRDTSGAGRSWMVWPLCGGVSREREDQWLFLPPLFSWTETRSKPWAEQGNSAPEIRLRCPWPIFEWEVSSRRDRLSVFPLYETTTLKSYSDATPDLTTRRFGWKLVELYPDETRVFPFWVSRADDAYFRLWPFWESVEENGARHGRFLSLLPIRWIPAVRRNWSKFWTLYENESDPLETRHSLFWGIIRWRTFK